MGTCWVKGNAMWTHLSRFVSQHLLLPALYSNPNCKPRSPISSKLKVKTKLRFMLCCKNSLHCQHGTLHSFRSPVSFVLQGPRGEWICWSCLFAPFRSPFVRCAFFSAFKDPDATVSLFSLLWRPVLWRLFFECVAASEMSFQWS